MTTLRKDIEESAANRQEGFTLIELLLVISIISILAALGVGLAGVASRKAKESRAYAQLHRLVLAIEAYHNDFNQYPPDNAYGGKNVDPILNPLYYELTGTLSINHGAAYEPAEGGNPIDVQTIYRAFYRKGFLNSAQPPNRPKNYLGTVSQNEKAEVFLQGIGTFTLLVVPVPWPVGSGFPPSPLVRYTSDPKYLRLNPWRYVSTNPTNNVRSYDLWVELIFSKERRLIANWEQ